MGTPDQYLAELAAACEVAHARGILCTNGGLPGGKVIRMTYMNYWDQGRYAEAMDFAARVTASSEEYAYMLDPTKVDWVRNASDEGHLFLDGYAAAGVDYVNFHWYETDARAFEEVGTFLADSTELPVITNEIGQRSDDPANISVHMQKILDLDLDYAIWFSLDKNTGVTETSVLALQNKDESLRRHGEAYKAFVAVHASAPGSRSTSLAAIKSPHAQGTKVDLVGGLVGDPNCTGGQVVELLRWKWNGTSASKIATATTAANGIYSFVQGVTTQGKKFQVVAPAAGSCARSESLIVTVMPL